MGKSAKVGRMGMQGFTKQKKLTKNAMSGTIQKQAVSQKKQEHAKGKGNAAPKPGTKKKHQ